MHLFFLLALVELLRRHFICGECAGDRTIPVWYALEFAMLKSGDGFARRFVDSFEPDDSVPLRAAVG